MMSAMTSEDRAQAKMYNNEYNGFEVRFANSGEYKLFATYGNALNYYCNHSACQLIGQKLDVATLSVIETVLEEKN